jgi:hypothetical protein
MMTLSERPAAFGYHSECPIKETYNTHRITVTGVGRLRIKSHWEKEPTSFFCRYVGYKFDKMRKLNGNQTTDSIESNIRKIWEINR